MRATLHTSPMPGKSLTPASPVPPRGALPEELHTALDIILAAAANLRHYRERLTPEDHIATVRDIEQAAEQISHGLERVVLPAAGVKRRVD